jgi:hypothetical protein
MAALPESRLITGGEPYLPFGVPKHLVAPATRFRSTWLTTSVRSLRERKLLAAYLDRLPPVHHEAVLQAVVGVWLPVEVAIAHYEACDGLGLEDKEIVAIGAEASDRAQRTTLGTATRLAAGAGVTPWALLSQLQRFWERIWIGGAVGVFAHGPPGPGDERAGAAKEARVEIVSWSCARIPYCRVGMRGVFLGMTEMFCRKAFVHEIAEGCSASTLAYLVQWA